MPWIPSQYNSGAGSSVTISRTAYDGSNSTQLDVFSGNLTTYSDVSLLNDLGQAQAGFSSSLRLRAAFQLKQLTGTNVSDRAELSLNLESSIGLVRAIHYVFASGSTLPANTVTDAYINVEPAPSGQWMTIDRNVAQDAANAFPGDYPTFNSVGQVTLTVYAQTQPGPENFDPHIKYWNFNTTQFQHWQSGLTVVYDANLNGVYGTGDFVLGCDELTCTTPPPGAPLFKDPHFSFTDPDNNGVYDYPSESVIYNSETIGGITISNDGIYDFFDPVIYANPTNPPMVGALLMKVFHNHTTALFDSIELYSATAGSDWVKNGGFEAGLTGWGANSSVFIASSQVAHSGAESVRGSITDGSSQIAQSIDGRPGIDPSTIFKASVNVETMSGESPSDIVDVWLGLVDARYNPVSLYYVFRTGDGSLPSNNVDMVYRKVNGFGTRNQWLTVNASLSKETAAFNLLGYTPPYSVEVIVAEVGAVAPTSATTAYFDDISLHGAAHTGTAPSNFYAVDGLNTTYAYTAAGIPQGSLHLEVPQGETILNITTPEGTLLPKNEYTTNVLTSCTVNPCIPNPRAIDIPGTAFFQHAPTGTWKVFLTSTNTIAKVYIEDPVSHTPVTSVKAGSTVNLVSLGQDPFGHPLSGVPVDLTLWNTSNGEQVGTWAGSTSSQGWWNVSSVTLPPASYPPGIYSLQAADMSTYPGIRTFQFSVVASRSDFQLLLSIQSPGTTIYAGQTMSLQVSLFPSGPPPSVFNGTVALTAQISPRIDNGPTVTLNPVTISQVQPGSSYSNVTVPTSASTIPGNYTLTITGTSGSLVHIVQVNFIVLPTPVITLTPSSGPVGTQVVVQGRHFAIFSQGIFSSPVEVVVTFDNQLGGFFLLHSSSFNFTFNVPLAQQGLHHIHAVEQLPGGLDVQADFTVTLQPSVPALDVSVSTGTIYFPGETATIFVTVSVNGQPTSLTTLQVVLVKPNGSSITLNPIQTAAGSWKATYIVPSTGSLGTYEVVVKAHQQGSTDGSGAVSFEVKPTWLQAHGSIILGATGLVGMAAVLALGWKKGLLTRKKKEFPTV